MSEAGEYFNFFNTTATASLASDPIDTALSGQRVSYLKYALPYNEGLFLYSDTAVFAVEHGEPLSVENIYITPIIQFDTEIFARPEIVGTSIFYTGGRGNFSSITEYSPGAAGGIYGYAEDITAHVPSYIPYGIKKLTGSMEESIVLALTGSNEVYVYKYQQGAAGEKIQSSWGKWVFGGKVENGEVINGVFYMLLDYGNGDVCLEKMHLNDTSEVFKDRKGFKDADYISSYTFSPLNIRGSSNSFAAGKARIRNITLKYEDSGPFKIIINRKGRKKEVRNIKPVSASGEVRVAVLAATEDVDITIESLSHNGFKFLETRFELLLASRSGS